MTWSSEALKHGIIPSKAESEMTERDWFEFRNKLDPDMMGFDNHESYLLDDVDEEDKISKISNTSTFNVIDNLTTRNYTNGSGTERIKYIVIHYTANNGDTAKSNSIFFKSIYRGASAHYFVDEMNVYRCVQDKDISWHCGGGLQGSNGHTFYKKCTNSNSIGIEMCSRINSNGEYYFKEQTVINCQLLVNYLINKYNISLANVIRHYDVTGKMCPAPMVKDSNAWNKFKNDLYKSQIKLKPGVYKVNTDKLNVRLGNSVNYEKIGELKINSYVEVYEFNNGWGKINYNSQNAWVSLMYLDYISPIQVHWAQPYLDTLINKGIITDKSTWVNFDKGINSSLVLALLDKMTGGVWSSNESNSNIHWAQPHIISLCGKGIISDKEQWMTLLDIVISKALLLSLVCNVTGGVSDLYKNRYSDHWARNSLDTLCDRGIINNPSTWIDFNSEVSTGQTMALLCKAIYR